MHRSKPAILISCSGLGMGNAARVFAIAQAIARNNPEAEVHFFSWGRGHEFLRQALSAEPSRFHLHSLAPYSWSEGGCPPPWKNVRRALSFIGAYLRNTRTLHTANRKLRPAAILLDSDYHFFAFPRRGRKLYFLGQAIDVVERARLIGYRPGWLSWVSFWACEVGDSLLQRWWSDKIFVPSFLEIEAEPAVGRSIRIPLIVRDEFRAHERFAPATGTIAVGSGSGLDGERLAGLANALGGSVFSPEIRDVRLTSPRDFLTAGIVVIQGGLSSISECIALRKPMLVAPIRGRAEQEVNAQTVERLGLGIACGEKEGPELAAAGAKISALAPPRVKILVHGSEVVAKYVLANL